MRVLRKASMVIAIAATATMGFATQAQASTNSGWVYTSNSSGAAYFDADLNGYPGVEKVTVCDNTSNNRGVQVMLIGKSGDGSETSVVYQSDPSNDGHCTPLQGNWFLEETHVSVTVYEYWTANDGTYDYANYGYGSGVA
ncbi:MULTISPECIES: hypothetical protein [unclassified Streptomyces]|uniref:hypothetical protein n=1 Tax=unclassified Streptomyces TaxID=2593676 RepID=UPI0036EB1FA6